MTAHFEFHDLHVHTRPHSPDAHWRARLPWMLKQASRNGVSTVGLANHYFPTTDFKLFQQLSEQVARKKTPNMRVLVGAELCVLDRTGRLNLTTAEAQQLDFILAGPHHFKQYWVEKPPTRTPTAFVHHQHELLLNAARHPLVNGLAHPWVINPVRWRFRIADFLAVWEEDLFAELGAVAKAHQTAIEIGMGIHLMAQHQGADFWTRYVRGLQAARLAGAKFYFGSDAHHLHIIARLDWLRPTLARLGFTPHDIISPEEWQASQGSSYIG